MLLEPPRIFGISQNNPVLSIIVPVGPLAHKLDNLKEWILQCPTSFELILVVDEQGDFTFDLLNRFLIDSTTQACITLLRGAYNGPGYARNEGLEFAQGVWIIFWDADDLPNLNATSNVVSRLRENQDLVVCGYEIHNGENRTSYVTRNWKELAYNPGIWRIFFRRSVIKDFAFPGLRLGEDQVFLSSAISKSARIDFEDECIYSYITSQVGQLTSGTSNTADLIEAADLIRVLGHKGTFDKIIEFRLRTTFIKRSISGCNFSILKFDWARYFFVIFCVLKNLGSK